MFGKTIADLTAEEAATLASEIKHNLSERKATKKLLFYALSEDEHCAKALRLFSDLLEEIVGEHVAVAVTEYIYDKVGDPQVKSRINLIRRLGLNRLDLLRHPNPNMGSISIEEWEHSSDFSIDEEGLAKVCREVLKTHTPREAFQAALLALGVSAGLVVPTTTQAGTSFDDFFQSENFKKADDYTSFLAAKQLQAEL